jgi:hypothetical protein
LTEPSGDRLLAHKRTGVSHHPFCQLQKAKSFSFFFQKEALVFCSFLKKRTKKRLQMVLISPSKMSDPGQLKSVDPASSNAGFRGFCLRGHLGRNPRQGIFQTRGRCRCQFQCRTPHGLTTDQTRGQTVERGVRFVVIRHAWRANPA